NGYRISGRRSLKPFNARVEGDYSQAAFFYAANALGSDIEIEGLNVKSFQGDKKIVEIFAEMVYNRKNGLNSFDLDCSDIPDLVPALAVMGAFAEGKSRIFNAERLRIKESDRIASTVLLINSLGGQAVPTDDGLVINGRKEISGGEVDACNDHRIAMAAAAASVGCKAGVLVRGAECVSKSYPDFWDVFKNLGGNIEVVG
ncbi:MAG: 3-phosphoshikimate 1-carboxyvinyltransferase, partial [Eubacterium sp.]|nr:3-phosphoshikimate 1-carboxyvinyltransferase [Eubacterium sp.]